MKVLIVAKTRQGSRACVGGITTEGQSVRLRAADYDTDESAGMEYEVGEVWEMDFAPAPTVIPPHVENVVVYDKRRLGRAHDVTGSIERYMPPVCGGPGLLYDGLVQAQDSGSLYICEAAGAPPRSTIFWRPDRPLELDDSSKRIRYRYEGDDGPRSLVYVGFQDPVQTIPAGTLLRVSLAHWWRRDEATEPRCYVQLSGWFGLDSSKALEPSAPGLPVTCEGQEYRLLKTVFGYDSFRPLQHQVVKNLLSGQDTLAVMPTGSGKSLCYQLPALIFDGITVVVSPLISLMQDQVEQLRGLGVPAAFLNGTVDYRSALATMNDARCGKIKLFYTSPESLLRPETLVMLDKCRVACLTIDEAHCISQWGHDFRPEYRQLLAVRQRYAAAVCVAFTATATQRVQDDIAAQLGMRDENRLVASFDRPNLRLRVEKRVDGGYAQVRSLLQRHRGESGIIYCTSRAKVDELALLLAKEGWPVLPYHAGLDDAARRRNQEDFTHDRKPVMVATIAFGMGINKSNVRFILHFHLPESIEHYYQEIGRAGRDGLPAECLLLYSRADLHAINHFIQTSAPEEQQGARNRLEVMLSYVQTRGCRRALLLRYFGEQGTTRCTGCDNCAPRELETWETSGVPIESPSVEPAGVLPRHALAFGRSDPGLFEKLRRLRTELAEDDGVPPFMVCSDRSLKDIVSRLPKTEAELLSAYGIGEYKLQKYGARLLQVVKAHMEQCAGHSPDNEGEDGTEHEPQLRGRSKEVGRLFLAGCTVEDLTTAFRVRRERILYHLSKCAAAGWSFPLDRVLPLCHLQGEERFQALRFMAELGPLPLRPVHAGLDGAVPYEELHALRLCYLCGERP